MQAPLYMISCFSLAAFKIFSLYLTFDSLILLCFSVGLFGFILVEILRASWVLISIPFLRFEKISAIIYLDCSLYLFFSLSYQMLSEKSLALSSLLFFFFFKIYYYFLFPFCSSDLIISNDLLSKFFLLLDYIWLNVSSKFFCSVIIVFSSRISVRFFSL